MDAVVISLSVLCHWCRSILYILSDSVYSSHLLTRRIWLVHWCWLLNFRVLPSFRDAGYILSQKPGEGDSSSPRHFLLYACIKLVPPFVSFFIVYVYQWVLSLTESLPPFQCISRGEYLIVFKGQDYGEWHLLLDRGLQKPRIPSILHISISNFVLR